MKINTKIALYLIKSMVLLAFLANVQNIFADELEAPNYGQLKSITNNSEVVFFQECDDCPKMAVIQPGEINYKKIDLNL